jgi:hypothetical protein
MLPGLLEPTSPILSPPDSRGCRRPKFRCLPLRIPLSFWQPEAALYQALPHFRVDDPVGIKCAAQLGVVILARACGGKMNSEHLGTVYPRFITWVFGSYRLFTCVCGGVGLVWTSVPGNGCNGTSSRCISAASSCSCRQMLGFRLLPLSCVSAPPLMALCALPADNSVTIWDETAAFEQTAVAESVDRAAAGHRRGNNSDHARLRHFPAIIGGPWAPRRAGIRW